MQQPDEQPQPQAPGNAQPAKKKMTGTQKTLITCGSLAAGAVFLVVGGIALLYLVFLPKVDEKLTSNYGKMTSLAFQNSQDVEGTSNLIYANHRLDVEPADLNKQLSWRTRLIPYVQDDILFSQFRMDEPWDSPVNRKLGQAHIKAFADDLPDEQTRFRVFYGNGAFFTADRTERIRTDKIEDGASNTLLFVQTTQTVPWSQCNEVRYDPAAPLPDFGKPNKSTFLVGMADGSVRFVRKSVDPKMIHAAITRNGGESVNLD